MRVPAVVPLLLATLISARVCVGLELSTPVFPSDDEVYEALLLGEIDYHQFVRLREIAALGIDSGSLFLYDEIPNLSFFRVGRRPLETALEADQKKPFAEDREHERPRAEFSYRYSERLDEDNETRYRASARIRFDNHLTGSFRIRREYSGSERFVGRAITYRNPRGVIHRVSTGTFSQRLGLGTIFGYRGKLLESSDELGGESLLFPDYGGFNGLLVEGGSTGFDITGLGSVARDDNHSLVTIGGMVQKKSGPVRPGLLIGVNRLKKRGHGSVMIDRKLGLYLESRYADGYSSLEISGQTGDPGTAGAVVVEGRHRFERAEIRYAGWAYGDSYRDLSSGSKTGNVAHDVEIEEVELGYSTKRSGQEGGLVRTVVEPGRRLRLSSSLLHARYSRYVMNTQFSGALTRRFSPAFSLQIDYLSTAKRRTEAYGGKAEVRRRARLEARLTGQGLSLRSHVAYNASTERTGYVSLFAVLRLSRPEFGRLELWSNLARLDDDGVEYWYVYVRNEQQLFDGVWVAAKFGHTYYEDAPDKYRPLLSLELKTRL